MGKIIGIDLGTTNSCVAVFEGGEPIVIPNPEGARTTPSVVAFTKAGERMVGQVAKRQAITNPDRTVISIKREMGSAFRKEIDGKNYTPQEISAMILQKLKADAEAYLGTSVTQAVNSLCYTCSEISLSVSLKLLENHRGYFLRCVILAVYFFSERRTHLTLDTDNSSVRVGNSLALCNLTYHSLTRLGESYYGRSRSRSFGIGDNYGLTALKYCHTRVCGS